ncbi:MAG: DUF4860 domain-containing protein, partial [Clostridia bacterium]|nr:DUF4860 domain-containing protein [Clostridia bacterium]
MRKGFRHENQGAGAVRGVFLFALLAVFALLSLIVVLGGARVYRAIDARGAQNYAARTALSYVAGKVRAGDEAEGLRVEALEDGAALLCLSSEYGGEEYV